MIFLAVFILLLFALAAIFVWLADNPGSVTVEWPWLGSIVELSLVQTMIALVVAVLMLMLIWSVAAQIINSPKSFGRWRAGRRRDKGYTALSRGLVAAGAGNAPLARKLTGESRKLLESEPLVAMLDAQTALLEGNRAEARKQFEAMLADDETKLLGLRGLYVEAEQEGAGEAAAHFAKQANSLAPGTPWASKAVLKAQAISADWEGALRTLGLNNANGLFEKDDYNRKRAVLLTAQAMEEEDGAPDAAKAHALAAHKAAPDLVPAALIAARSAVRLNDLRKAGKVLEACWKRSPHPEVADLYVNLKPGDSAAARLKRADALFQMQPDQVESYLAVAQAATFAGEFSRARDAMENVLRTRPTERACLLMADIEEAEHGDRGRVREWLSRAVTSAKDPAWIADGVASETWAPVSPVTGRLDAFEWKSPAVQLAGSGVTADYSLLAKEPLAAEKAGEPEPNVLDEAHDIEVVDITPVSEKPDAETDTDPNKDRSESSPSTIEKTIDAVSVGGSVGAVAAGVAGVTVAAVTEPATTPVETAKPDTPKEAGKPEAKETDPAKSDTTKSAKSSSPFRTTNLDEDDDGIIDRRPDDPGTSDLNGTQKKGVFF